MKYKKQIKHAKKTIPSIIIFMLIIGLLHVSFINITSADTATIPGDRDDGHITAMGLTYNEAHDASSGTVINNNYYLYIGQQYFDKLIFAAPGPILDSYSIYRGFVYFDTSNIPAEATITSVSLKLITSRDYSNTNFDVRVINGQPTYPHKPLRDIDYAISHYSDNGGSWNTANYPGNTQEITIALNSNGRSWIQKGAGAVTKFALLSSRDINGNIPIPQEPLTYALEYVTFYSANSAGNEPKLEVTYTTNSPPNTPSRPLGPSSRNTGQSGTYSTSATDPDGNQVQYRFDWDAYGGHDYSSWTSLVNSGTPSSQSHPWTNPGTYTVKAQARDSNGATSSWSNGLTVTVTTPNNPPTASYTANPNPTTTGQNINFDASASSDTDGFITTYEWDWDNNGIYDNTGINPIHSWPTQGNYPVTLRVTDDDGATDTNTQTITINPPGNNPPTASYTANPNPTTTGQNINFDASASSDTDGFITTYEWDWDNNGIYDNTGINPIHSWPTQGNYPVTLRVTDDDGATDTNTQTITINPPGNNPPTASYTANPNPTTTGQNINFDASASSDTDGFITTYEWDWDNNGIYDNTGINPIHSWPTQGNYPVTLRVTDDDGATDTNTQTITINPPGDVPPNKPTLVSPAPSGTTTGSENTATLSVTAIDLNGGQINVSFYGGGNFLYNETKASGSMFTFTWNGLTAGTQYTWYAVANDSVFKNKSDTWSFTTKSSGGGGGGANTNTAPTADAGGPYTGIVDKEIIFDGSESSDAEGPIKEYKWYFEDDETYNTDWLTEPTIARTYSSAGVYTVKLRVKDNMGATSSIDTATVNISETSGTPPTADAGGPYAGLTYQSITFDGSGSYDDKGSIVNYTWDFDDGTIAYGEKVVHSYNTSGVFNVTLTVKDDDGLTNSNTTTATITLDTDGDGWSDEIEESYETNTTDPNDYPQDTDNDGTSDEDSSDGKYIGDLDDDNDGLEDKIEEMTTGSDPKNKDDVKLREDGKYDIDFNVDSKVDGIYDPVTQKFTESGKQDNKTKKAMLSSTLMIIAAIISTIIVFAVALLYNKHPQPITSNMGKLGNQPIVESPAGDAILFEQQIDQIIQEVKQADSKPQNAESKNRNCLLVEEGVINKASLIVDNKDKTTPAAKDVSYEHGPVNNRSMMADREYRDGLSYEHGPVNNNKLSGTNGKDISNSSVNNGLLHEHVLVDDKQKIVQRKSKTSPTSGLLYENRLAKEKPKTVQRKNRTGSSRRHDTLIYEQGSANGKYKSRVANKKNRSDFSVNALGKNSRGKSGVSKGTKLQSSSRKKVKS